MGPPLCQCFSRKVWCLRSVPGRQIREGLHVGHLVGEALRKQGSEAWAEKELLWDATRASANPERHSELSAPQSCPTWAWFPQLVWPAIGWALSSAKGLLWVEVDSVERLSCELPAGNMPCREGVSTWDLRWEAGHQIIMSLTDNKSQTMSPSEHEAKGHWWLVQCSVSQSYAAVYEDAPWGDDRRGVGNVPPHQHPQPVYSLFSLLVCPTRVWPLCGSGFAVTSPSTNKMPPFNFVVTSGPLCGQALWTSQGSPLLGVLGKSWEGCGYLWGLRRSRSGLELPKGHGEEVFPRGCEGRRTKNVQFGWWQLRVIKRPKTGASAYVAIQRLRRLAWKKAGMRTCV